MSYPLPVSSTWNDLQGIQITAGIFATDVLIWPPEWYTGGKLESKHVGILQKRDLSFVFIYLEKNSGKVKLLTEEYWDVFKRKFATAASNRYYVNVNNKTFLVPYVPCTLYRRWGVKRDGRCDAYVETLWKKAQKNYHPQNVTIGWERHEINYEGYIKEFFKEENNPGALAVDISTPFKSLSQGNKEVVRQAFRLVHCIFPNVISRQ